MARKRKEITDILIEVGALKAPDAARATEEAGRTHRPLHEVILDLKLASEEEVTKALAYQYDMEYIDLDKSMLATSNFNLIPPDLIKKHQVLPLDKKEGDAADRHRRSDGHRHDRCAEVSVEHEDPGLSGREVEDQAADQSAVCG